MFLLCSGASFTRTCGSNAVTERIIELVEIISELQIESIQRKDHESLLEIAMASRLLFRALPGAEEQSQSALYSMENALSLLIDAIPPADVSETEPACSFCGKKRPEVQLGAGAGAEAEASICFICNECVGLFVEIFDKEKEGKASN
jgi:hypothetical protein